MFPSTGAHLVVRPLRHPSLLPAQRESPGRDRGLQRLGSDVEVPEKCVPAPLAWVKFRRGKQGLQEPLLWGPSCLQELMLSPEPPTPHQQPTHSASRQLQILSLSPNGQVQASILDRAVCLVFCTSAHPRLTHSRTGAVGPDWPCQRLPFWDCP